LFNYLGERIFDNFSVTDNDDNLVPSIDISEFTYHLFDPFNNEVSSSINVIIKELGHGHYRIKFFPDKIGSWYLVLYHESYFPWGKAASFNVMKKEKTRVKP